MDNSLSTNGVGHTGKSVVDHSSAIIPENGQPHANGTLPLPHLPSDQKTLNIANCEPGQRTMQSRPVAITGMAMKLPGGVRTAEGFWDFLIQGKDGHSQVPPSRYSMSAHHNTTRADFVRTAGGYFLQDDDPAKFDPDFFHLRPQLAAALDPQQRLVVEAAWECIENAGETNLVGRNVGCFVGAFGNDWMEMAVHDRQDYDRNHVACNHDFTLANQISRVFDFRGPRLVIEFGSRRHSVTVVDVFLSVLYRTACSSSMTALHHACQAVESGECEMAMVAGVNLILSPTTSNSISAYGALSPDGLCKTFDSSADGYGRGEGVNAILIKKLDLAVQNEDPIRAVIRATAINSDGNSPMPGVPRPESQETLIRMAYEKAAIEDFSQTAFFECHGTGTQKGDVIEASVIAKIFEKGIMMGSVSRAQIKRIIFDQSSHISK